MDGAGYPIEEPSKDLLRFLTCGSVDDGKSTLIGRLLHDSKLIFEDQLSALAKDSARHGTTGDHIDFALLVDGLEAAPDRCAKRPSGTDATTFAHLLAAWFASCRRSRKQD